MRHLKCPKPIIIYLALILTLLLSGNTFAENVGLFFNFKMHQPLELAPHNTQLLFRNGELNALSIIKGKLLFFRENGAKWTELQRFGPHDISFTTFEIKDLNGDNTPEIIAGTEDPGLIYLYTWDNGQWSLLSYGKHVWSTINKIIIGNLSGAVAQELLVQNDEGYLFLLKLSNNALDLVWKSPNVWQPINTAVVADINNDSSDEILVVYKTGGIAILTLDNNAVVSVWENYPWGKVLGLTVGDWDNDQHLEVIFSTSQKLLYVLGENGNEYRYEGQFSDFDFIIEKLSFINQENKALITTNTSGLLKILQYDIESRKWTEKLSNNTGRILQIAQPNPEQAILWSSNRKIIELSSYKSLSLLVIYKDLQYQLEPNALSFYNQVYIAPKALANLFGLDVFYDDQSQTFSIKTNERTIAFTKNEPNLVWIDGLSKITLPVAPIIIDDELFLSLDTYRNLLNQNLVFNSRDQTISLF